MKKFLVNVMVLFLVFFQLSSCRSIASIENIYGMEYQGKILGSDDDVIYFDSGNHISSIKKNEIEVIRHPGSTRGLVWVGVAACSVLSLAATQYIYKSASEDQRIGIAVGASLPIAISVPFMAEGFIAWNKSRRTMNKPYNP